MEESYIGSKLQYERILAQYLGALASHVHANNQKWWTDLSTGAYPIQRNIGELLMLATSELAEALEGHRKNCQDTHLPHRKMFEVEIVDCIIRLLDIAGGLGLDIAGAFVEKMEYNRNREDHRLENRRSEGGKKY